MIYEWVVSPESPELGSGSIFSKPLREIIKDILRTADKIVNSDKIFPFIISFILFVTLLVYILKYRICQKSSSGKRKFWILRRDKTFSNLPSMVVIDSADNSNNTSEDEFINHQENYDMLF
jgi:hypothetical protein